MSNLLILILYTAILNLYNLMKCPTSVGYNRRLLERHMMIKIMYLATLNREGTKNGN